MSCGPIIVIQNQGSVTRTVMEQNPVVTQNNGSTLVVQRASFPVVTQQNATIQRPIVQTQLLTDITVGPQGPQGEPGEGASFTVTAGQNLNSPIVVAIDAGVAHPADPTNVSDMSSQLAVTTQSVVSGAPVVVITAGQMTEPMWTWSPGRIYLALTGGALTQTPDPVIGAILEVGRAISATTIEFGIQTAILR